MEHPEGKRGPASLVWTLTFLGLGFAVELIAILRLNAGHFTYTLDDPYIHLALAERIRGGHYGINPGEVAAPASSILWPFLLAPFASTGLGELIPLLSGIAASLVTVGLYHHFVAGHLTSGRPGLTAFGTLLLALGTNLIGLPFTGMEHSLQVFLTVCVVLGLLAETETGRAPTWLLISIAIGPCVRYENLALSFFASAYLFLRGHKRKAAITAAAFLVPLGVFSAFLLGHGLGPLPSSVLQKGAIFSDGLLSGLRESLRDPTGVLLALASTWMAGLAVLGLRKRAERLLAGALSGTVAMHLVAGRYGAYHRWEMYIVAATALSVLYFERRRIALLIASHRAVPLAVFAFLILAASAGRYVFGLATIPVAANNVFEQQYQMHRFAVEFEHGPVVVNDIGYVAYRNPYPVLDLLGLGSRGFARGPWEPLDIRALTGEVSQRGIETAMVYENWFPSLPSEWRRVGVLRLSRPRVTPAWSGVAFYATKEEAYPRVLERVAAFRSTLPPGVSFETADH